MKWKNIDIGAAYYYVTGTFTEWLPLLNNADVRGIVCDEIARAMSECGGWVSALFLEPGAGAIRRWTDAGGFGLARQLASGGQVQVFFHIKDTAMHGGQHIQFQMVTAAGQVIKMPQMTIYLDWISDLL